MLEKLFWTSFIVLGGFLLPWSVDLSATCLPSCDAFTGPEIRYLFPLGGQRGSTVNLAITGRGLEGAYAVVTEEKGITGSITSVEEVIEKKVKIEAQGPETKKKKDKDFRVFVSTKIEPFVNVGDYWIRLVTPNGISNPFHFRVNGLQVINESDLPHHVPEEAQPINYPVIINGSITNPGEIDYYEVQVPKGERLLLKVTPSRGAVANVFRSQLGIYEKSGSWFDSKRLVRLAFSDKDRGSRVVDNKDQRRTTGSYVKLQYHFLEEGQYIVSVGSLNGQAEPDYIYQLEVISSKHSSQVESQSVSWNERSFTRNLTVNRLEQLWARGVRIPVANSNQEKVGKDDAEEAGLDSAFLDFELSSPTRLLDKLIEKEPNNKFIKANARPNPAIIEGVIETPGDFDIYKFSVAAGQKLAFEIETVGLKRPDFNPMFQILNSKGEKKFSNLRRSEKYKNVNSPHLISVDPKIIGTFEQAGDYYLKVRDVTLRKGGSLFSYRLLIRPQVPHVGNMVLETRTLEFEDGRTDPNRLNIVPGKSAKFTLILDQEEGFSLPSNQVAVLVEGLPNGVQAFPAASRYQFPERRGPQKIKDTENHLPYTQKINVVLHALEDALPTRLPVWLTVKVRPFVQGKSGLELVVRKVPLMILDPSSSMKVSRLGDSQ